MAFSLWADGDADADSGGLRRPYRVPGTACKIDSVVHITQFLFRKESMCGHVLA